MRTTSKSSRRTVALLVAAALALIPCAAWANPQARNQAEAAAADHIKSQLNSPTGMAEEQLKENLMQVMSGVPGGADLMNGAFAIAVSMSDLGFPGMSMIAGPLMESLFGSRESAMEMKLAELDSRLGVAEKDIATLQLFSYYVAERVNQLNDEVRAVWIGQSASDYRRLSSRVRTIKDAPKYEQQATINDIAIQADRFLPVEIQSKSPVDPLGDKRWYNTRLLISYDPARAGDKLQFGYDRVFAPEAAITRYVAFLALLLTAQEATGLKPDPREFKADNHILFLTGPFGGNSLLEMMKPVSCGVNMSSRYVDRQGECTVNSYCLHFKRLDQDTEYRIQLRTPTEQSLCGAKASLLPSLDKIAYDLMVDESGDGNIRDPLLDVARQAAARLKGKKSWTPNQQGPQYVGTFDTSTRALVANVLYAVSTSGELVQYEAEHFERKRTCPPRTSANASAIASIACRPLRLVGGATSNEWQPVNSVRRIASIASGWGDVRSMATLSSWHNGDKASFGSAVVLKADGTTEWVELSLKSSRGIAFGGCLVISTTNGKCKRTAPPTTPVFSLNEQGTPLGWAGYRTIISGGIGTLYAVDAAGDLYWIKDKSASQKPANGNKTLLSSRPRPPCRPARGPAAVANCAPPVLAGVSTVSFNRIGEGWGNFRDLAAGADGAIYAIDSNGRLLWYKHTLWANDSEPYPATRWKGPKTVGTGWERFKSIAVDSSNNIYALTPNGDLLFYRIRANDADNPRWSEPETIATGWTDYRTIFLRNDYSNRGPIVN